MNFVLDDMEKNTVFGVPKENLLKIQEKIVEQTKDYADKKTNKH